MMTGLIPKPQELRQASSIVCTEQISRGIRGMVFKVRGPWLTWLNPGRKIRLPRWVRIVGQET